MRATIQQITNTQHKQSLQLICNQIEPNYVSVKLPTKKYHKVGKQSKAKLIRCIQNGWSIINVAKKFNINYSTAKSIVQCYRKKQKYQQLKAFSTQSSSQNEEIKSI